jgi:hypothetical protein
MGNPAERFNQTLIRMLGTLETDQKTDWKSFIGPMVQAYNATKSSATGYSPHYLMFGWHPRLALDAYLGTDPGNEGSVDPTGYVQKLQNRLQQAYKLAAEASAKQGVRNKAYYDRKVCASRLEVNDRVLVRQVHFDGRHKLADKWETYPYTILDIPNPEIPVYRVRREDGKGPERVRHRNLLLPFNSLSPSDSSVPTRHKSSRPKPNQTDRVVQQLGSGTDSEGSSSESEPYVIPQRRPGYQPVPVKNFKSSGEHFLPRFSSETSEVNRPNLVSGSPVQPYVVSPLPESVMSRTGDQAENTPSTVQETFGPSGLSGSAQFLSSRSIPKDPAFVSRSHESVSHSIPEPSPEPVHRPQRLRKPPDRYGEWVSPLIATEDVKKEVHIYYV